MFLTNAIRSILTTYENYNDDGSSTPTTTSSSSSPSHNHNHNHSNHNHNTVSEVGNDLGPQINKWRGGVLSPTNGCIYGIPCWATHVLRFDPISQTATPIGSDMGSEMYKWSGGVFCPNTGCVYGVPCNSRRVLKIDPVTEDTELVGGDLGDGHMKWISGVMGDDGCLYCMPYDARRILRFDPRTEETVLVGDDLGEGYKYSDTVLLDSGPSRCSNRSSNRGRRRDREEQEEYTQEEEREDKKECLLGIPFNASRVVHYNPTNNTTEYLGDDLSDLGNAKWCGGVQGTDGNIYGVPNFHSHLLRIETSPRSWGSKDYGGTDTRVGNYQYGNKGKWYGAARGEDGRLYFAPSCSDRVLRYDYEGRSTTLLHPRLTGGYYKWSGCVLSEHDGCVYCVPSSSRYFLRVDTRLPIGRIHWAVRMKFWGCVRRLLRDGTKSREEKFRALGERDKEEQTNVLCAALVGSAPYGLVGDIVRGNYVVLAERDVGSGLYPFMLAAVGPESCLGNVYDLLRCHPALIHEFVS